MNSLYAPEMRPDDGTRHLTSTPTGVLIGSAYLRPSPPPTADAERLQLALIGRPKVIRLYTNSLVRALRWLLSR